MSALSVASPLLAQVGSSGGIPRTNSSDVRLAVAGVPLTRSKSDRARLLSIAQDVLSDPPLQRSAASDLQISMGEIFAQPSIPLTRSAASELALSIDATMSL